MKTIRINRTALVMAFKPEISSEFEGHYCLDLETGDILETNDCDRSLMGEGRPSVAMGKRFIKIQPLTELAEQLRGPIPSSADELDKIEVSAKAAEETAMRWIRSIQPKCRVEIFDGYEDGPTVLDYDPDSNGWSRHA